MASLIRNAALIGGLVALGACGNGGVFNRDAPDEFSIGRSAPLVVPPDYNLAPPRPGAPRPVESDSQTNAMEALFGAGARVPAKSPAEQQILEGAGADEADPTARSTAGDPGTEVVDKGAFLKTIIDAQPQNSNASVAEVNAGG